MSAITFDSLGYFNYLKAAGISDEQANAHVNALQLALSSYAESKGNELASKSDIHTLDLKIEKIHAETQIEIQKSKNDIIKWGVSALIAQTALLVAVLTILR